MSINKENKSIQKILLNAFIFSIKIWAVMALIYFVPSSLTYKRCSLPRLPDVACMSNCRILTGAIEMFDMDHENEKYKSYNINLDPSGTILDGYYKKISKPDSKCSYKYDYSSNDPIVYCLYHGYSDKRIKSIYEKEKEKKELINNITTPILYLTILSAPTIGYILFSLF